MNAGWVYFEDDPLQHAFSAGSVTVFMPGTDKIDMYISNIVYT